MTAIYSQIYFGDDTLLNSALAELRAVDAIIWCDIDLPWQSDGIQRDGVHMRQAAHQAIGALLSRSPDLSALLVSGSVAERGAVVQRTLLP
jgi:nicotinamide riboside kinase